MSSKTDDVRQEIIAYKARYKTKTLYFDPTCLNYFKLPGNKEFDKLLKSVCAQAFMSDRAVDEGFVFHLDFTQKLRDGQFWIQMPSVEVLRGKISMIDIFRMPVEELKLDDTSSITLEEISRQALPLELPLRGYLDFRESIILNPIYQSYLRYPNYKRITYAELLAQDFSLFSRFNPSLSVPIPRVHILGDSTHQQVMFLLLGKRNALGFDSAMALMAELASEMRALEEQVEALIGNIISLNSRAGLPSSVRTQLNQRCQTAAGDYEHRLVELKKSIRKKINQYYEPLAHLKVKLALKLDEVGQDRLIKLTQEKIEVIYLVRNAARLLYLALLKNDQLVMKGVHYNKIFQPFARIDLEGDFPTLKIQRLDAFKIHRMEFSKLQNYLNYVYQQASVWKIEVGHPVLSSQDKKLIESYLNDGLRSISALEGNIGSCKLNPSASLAVVRFNQECDPALRHFNENISREVLCSGLVSLLKEVSETLDDLQRQYLLLERREWVLTQTLGLLKAFNNSHVQSFSPPQIYQIYLKRVEELFRQLETFDEKSAYVSIINKTMESKQESWTVAKDCLTCKEKLKDLAYQATKVHAKNHIKEQLKQLTGLDAEIKALFVKLKQKIHDHVQAFDFRLLDSLLDKYHQMAFNLQTYSEQMQRLFLRNDDVAAFLKLISHEEDIEVESLESVAEPYIIAWEEQTQEYASLKSIIQEHQSIIDAFGLSVAELNCVYEQALDALSKGHFDSELNEYKGQVIYQLSEALRATLFQMRQVKLFDRNFVAARPLLKLNQSSHFEIGQDSFQQLYLQLADKLSHAFEDRQNTFRVLYYQIKMKIYSVVNNGSLWDTAGVATVKKSSFSLFAKSQSTPAEGLREKLLHFYSTRKGERSYQQELCALVELARSVDAKQEGPLGVNLIGALCRLPEQFYNITALNRYLQQLDDLGSRPQKPPVMGLSSV